MLSSQRIPKQVQPGCPTCWTFCILGHPRRSAGSRCPSSRGSRSWRSTCRHFASQV
uniref:Uncharacterized protein n=1 Tax=Anguilla anguilla TaxID=7936 RepID=A0A0E9VN48_ANGAN